MTESVAKTLHIQAYACHLQHRLLASEKREIKFSFSYIILLILNDYIGEAQLQETYSINNQILIAFSKEIVSR